MLAVGAKADEGMWLLPLLKEMNIKSMRDLGCRLKPEEIYSINHSSLKDAIVMFGGGCTGEIISDDGLLTTNHHCGFSSIQKLSTPEHNYLENGFWAMNRNEELPVKGLSVRFLQSFTDITPILDKIYQEVLDKNKGQEDAEHKAETAKSDAILQLKKDAQRANPFCTIDVTTFYNDNVYYLIVYKIYKDVRLVGTPPVSLGKFGGETDNWMWPRHTCDFSMFRVYADKNNEPAEYSADNVPYTPKRSLKISLKGVKEGDFTMIMGYPAATQRFQTSDQLESLLKRLNVVVGARTVYLSTMLKGMESDPVVRLKYADKYAGLSNGWKKWQGEQLAVDKLDVLGDKRAQEEALLQWINEDNARVAKYGNPVEEVASALSHLNKNTLALSLATQSVERISVLKAATNFFYSFYLGLNAKENSDTAKVISDAVESSKAYFKDFDLSLEKELAYAVLDYYRKTAKPEYYLSGIGDFKTMDFRAYVDSIYSRSLFATSESIERCKGMSIADIMKDPGIALMEAVDILETILDEEEQDVYLQIDEGSRKFAAAMLEWKKGSPMYPDANSTMRLTYGQVKPYSPKNGVLYQYYTTSDGLLEKEDPDNYEFRLEPMFKQAFEQKRFGRFADKDGELVTCFLTNNDITGGNSGSPVLNAKGEMIGLAFDGNWESMSSDIMFEPNLQRCICVDIRYVLYVIEKSGAGYLFNEMTFVK